MTLIRPSPLSCTSSWFRWSIPLLFSTTTLTAFHTIHAFQTPLPSISTTSSSTSSIITAPTLNTFPFASLSKSSCTGTSTSTSSNNKLTTTCLNSQRSDYYDDYDYDTTTTSRYNPTDYYTRTYSPNRSMTRSSSYDNNNIRRGNDYYRSSSSSPSPSSSSSYLLPTRRTKRFSYQEDYDDDSAYHLQRNIDRNGNKLYKYDRTGASTSMKNYRDRWFLKDIRRRSRSNVEFRNDYLNSRNEFNDYDSYDDEYDSYDYGSADRRRNGRRSNYGGYGMNGEYGRRWDSDDDERRRWDDDRRISRYDNDFDYRYNNNRYNDYNGYGHDDYDNYYYDNDYDNDYDGYGPNNYRNRRGGYGYDYLDDWYVTPNSFGPRNYVEEPW